MLSERQLHFGCALLVAALAVDLGRPRLQPMMHVSQCCCCCCSGVLCCCHLIHQHAHFSKLVL